MSLSSAVHSNLFPRLLSYKSHSFLTDFIHVSYISVHLPFLLLTPRPPAPGGRRTSHFWKKFVLFLRSVEIISSFILCIYQNIAVTWFYFTLYIFRKTVQYKQISLPTSYTMFISIIQCFYVFRSNIWPPSGSYKFQKRARRIWQIVTDDIQ